MENKISKICWNFEGWKFPSGSQGKSAASKSFEAEYGYGHEEWLFDRSRIVNGYHYAFLQPLNLKSDTHVGKTYNIFLFTITDGIKYFVGQIKNAACISKAESSDIYKIYKQKKWLKEMVKGIEQAGANPKTFTRTSPNIFFNVKFKFEDVIRPEEVEELSDKDINITTTRYRLLPKSTDFKFVAEISDEENEGKFRNTKRRNRIYKVDSSFDPYHDKLQNALCALLRDQYKNEYKTVAIEKDRVDIKGKTHSDKWHYFEIKTDSPKLSLRNALGQILEYSCWPDSERAEKLIIVSDNDPDSDTKKYLAHIRRKFNLPIFYRFFNMNSNVLSEDF
ncbi:MAG: hypothetical protein A2W77_07110 [Nitrospinae bacterium RIFCSPLOWO2_12_39_16]|nr:MAG: hypothetical protein A2Z59_10705 [Nitrospinae bacterium RIFCSPLOWO2_02_39_17]OGW12466.1 MAG: hypothetical protein A2W77_07110 [Nitrospinae bacterium RIFCSPLOWO2_12_39_16]